MQEPDDRTRQIPLNCLRSLPEALRRELEANAIVSCQALYGLLQTTGRGGAACIAALDPEGLEALRAELEATLPEQARHDIDEAATFDWLASRPPGLLPPEDPDQTP